MPHGISAARWKEVAQAFSLGGFVTAYECDAYLRLSRGTALRAIHSGRLKAQGQPYGRGIRYVVGAAQALAVLRGGVLI